MKYIKKFENINSIKEGDYVLVKTSKTTITNEIILKSKEFVDTHIGRCVRINRNHFDPEIHVKYENIPSEIQSYFRLDYYGKIGYRSFNLDRVVAYGETPEEVEMKINVNKYNL